MDLASKIRIHNRKLMEEQKRKKALENMLELRKIAQDLHLLTPESVDLDENADEIIDEDVDNSNLNFSDEFHEEHLKYNSPNDEEFTPNAPESKNLPHNLHDFDEFSQNSFSMGPKTKKVTRLNYW